MEGIGLALGSVSLLFQVFAGCIKGYQLLSEARGLEKTHQYFRVRFKTEQYRLLDWAAIVELTEDDDTLVISKVSRPVLLDVLDQQCRLMLRFGRLDDRLRPLARPLLHEEAGKADNSQQGLIRDEEADDSLQSRFPNTNALLEKSLKFIQATSKYPARLRWAMSDKSKIEEILGKLSSLNDYLDQLLNNQQLQSLNTQQIRTNYQIMQLNNKIDHLCEIVKASLSVAMSDDQIKSNSNFPEDALQAPPSPPPEHLVEMKLANLAQVKALMSAIDNGSLTDNLRLELGLKRSRSHTRPMEISAAEIQFVDEGIHRSDQRVPAWYKPPLEPWRRVWVEWKSVQSRRPNMVQDRSHSLVLGRFEALVQLLREDTYTSQFRTLRCLGYHVRQSNNTGLQHGLVFENPTGIDPLLSPSSLTSLFNSVKPPSLTSRLALIKVLAECIERLHAVDWLHKGLRSQNVIFFREETGKFDLSQPFLSGFDYSRPEGADDLSESPPAIAAEDLYRHPNVQGGPREDSYGMGYKKHHDIYSLGIVSLEIVYWKPIYEILGFQSVRTMRPSETARAKEMLLAEEYGDHIKSYMGDVIADIIRTCLTGPASFGMKEEVSGFASYSGAKLQERFFEVVVKRLHELRI